MTGAAPGGIERGTGAPSRWTGTQGTVGAIAVVLALGLLVRIALLVALPGSGFAVDRTAFQFWASWLASHGPWGFYDQSFLHDYTPGYMYVLWLVGIVGAALGGIGDLIKVPAILSDLAVAWLIHGMVLELGGRRRVALIAAAVAVLNPIAWFDSVAWGQVDSFGVVFLLLGLRALWRDQPERSAVYTVIAAIIKPQLGILVPLVAVVTIRRALWPAGGEGDPAGRTGRPILILTTALAGLATAIVLCIPFGLTPLGLLEQLLRTGGTYPYISVNAYNPWALVTSDVGASIAAGGRWACDAAWGASLCDAGVASIAGIPAIFIGTGLLLAAFAAVLVVVARRPDRITLTVALAILALAFFVLPTRVHERYGYPFFALAILLAAVSWRWRVATLVIGVATFANMYVVLTTLYPDNPGISDWLGIGPAIRSQLGITAVVVAHSLGFVWVFLQLRATARASLAADLARESGTATADGALVAPGVSGDRGEADDESTGTRRWAEVPTATTATGAGAATSALASERAGWASVPFPTWTLRPSFADLGFIGWIRDRWSSPSVRPDRSASLVGERGGRLDRLDLWILAVLVVASLVLRMFRLAEPYQMHFDEVYHARTAAEFLQDWRYGESHDIYEWTHPHLAKYLMAAGIVAFGDDRVTGTSELGVPVLDAVIEPRRADATAPDGRAGERLYVATGSEVRAYDLRTRGLIGSVPVAGVRVLAVDDDGSELVMGTADGKVLTLDPTAIDGGLGSDGLLPTTLATVAGPITHLLLSGDGTSIAVASGDRLTILDRTTGSVVGSLSVGGLADLADGGTAQALVATIANVPDPSAAASALAAITGASETSYLAKLRGPAATVVLGSPTGDQKTSVQSAIDDGRLVGLAFQDVSRVAVAGSNGLTFVDVGSATVTATVAMNGGAHGVGAVRLDDPKLYVASGTASQPEYHVVLIGGDGAKNGPVDQGAHVMPGLGSRVVYDTASQMVHILGRAPGAGADGPWTVYVIEPHGNAVYADARLATGFTPTALAIDVNAQYPTDDRQQILVFDGAGSTAAIDIGSHEFSWRVPGVIAGTITLVLLYLLTRILFRRRLVAALVGLFVLVDGMFFVMARIGMNDVYVGLFIVAAYTLFAAVWTGWWRGRLVFWASMPVIGVLLGLALASKWVALYAIGGIGLLILARSALGRVLLVLAMISLTGVLGYMGIVVPNGQGLGNLLFLVVMIVLTLVTVVVVVLHPIAWTDEEVWISLGTPLAVGALLFFGALALGGLQTHLAIGPLSITPLEAAVAAALGSLVVYALFVLGGRMGLGPYAAPASAGDPRRALPPPGPAAHGWLRPGHLAGLPIVWAVVCILVIPVAVYVASYIPWAFVENHRITNTWPPGHTGQTLIDLTKQMYGYHNGLTAPHPASSPWWAWPLDLKPVWFYQNGLGGGTTAAIYDAGNLVIWWVGVAALIFVSVMAYRRRSPALALIAVGFACQWIPWARIDRAAFQYHYYTALPFVVMALAYFIAELWHGASRATWAFARLSAGVAILLPAILWFLTRPLCGIVDVFSVNPGSQACPPVVPDFVLTARALAQGVAAAVALYLVVRTVLDVASGERAGLAEREGLRHVLLVSAAATLAIIAASFVPAATVLRLTRVPVEPVALIVAIPLAWVALAVIAGRDPRRFVVGYVAAAVGWFAILYPNIAALPLPTTVVNAYQGIVPTYLYAFQFSVSRIDRNQPIALFTPNLALLLLALLATCGVVAYSAIVWRRTSVTGSLEAAAADGDGLARTGGA